MKILFISPVLGEEITGEPNGIGDYMIMLLNQLSKTDNDITVLTSNYENIREMEFIKVYPKIKSWGFASIIRILKVIKQQKFQVIHLVYEQRIYKLSKSKKEQENIAVYFLPLAIKSFFKNAKIVIQCHEIGGPSIFRGADILHLRKLVMKMFFNFAHSIIVSDMSHKVYLKNTFNINPTKILLIPIGYSIPQEYYSDGGGKKSDKREFKIAYFGIVNYGKCPDLLLLAVGELVKKGRFIKLLFAGGNDTARYKEFYRELMNLTEKLNISKNVEFTGYLEKKELVHKLGDADLYVMPYSQGVSTSHSTIITLLPFGKAIITTKGSHIPECFKDNYNVSLIEPKNLNQLIHAIENLMDSDCLRKFLGSNAKKLSVEFSWEKISQSIINVYEGVLKR